MIAVGLAVVLLEGGTIGFTDDDELRADPSGRLAETPATQPKDAEEKDAEVSIVDAKLPNSSAGHLYLYDIQVVAKVSESNKAKVTDILNRACRRSTR